MSSTSSQGNLQADETIRRPWALLVSHLLEKRKPEKQSTYAAELSALKRGGNHATAHYAEPYIEPYLVSERGESRDRERKALLGVAALIVSFRAVPHAHENRLGEALAKVSIKRSPEGTIDPDKPDAIASRLRSMRYLDQQSAIAAFRSILSLVEGTDVAINYYDLAERIVQWGHGFSEQSVAVRQSTLREYYSRAAVGNTSKKSSL